MWTIGLMASEIDSLRQQIQDYQGTEDAEALALSYLELGEEYFKMFEHKEALRVLKAGLEASREGQDRELEFRILDDIGHAYSWMDDYRRAIEYHWLANELPTENISPEYLAENYSHIGEIYIMLGNLRQALDYQLQARELYETTGDVPGTAAATDKIGHIYWKMGAYEKALVNLRKAQTIYKETGQDLYLYQVRATTARVYKDLNRMGKAMVEARASLDQAEAYGYQFGIAYSQALIGEILELRGENLEAERYLTKAIEQFRLAGIKYELGEFSVILARIRRKKGQAAPAFQLLDRAMEIANDLHSLELKTAVLEERANVFHALGDDQAAFRTLQEFKLKNDSLLDVESMRQASSLEMDYELRKREKQIESLKSEAQFAQTRFLVLAISGSLVMVSLILWLMYMRYRGQARAGELLRQKHEEIQRQNEALSASNSDLRRFSDLAAMDLRLPVDHIREALEDLYDMFPDVSTSQSYGLILKNLGELDNLLAGISAFSVVNDEQDTWEPIEVADVVKEAIRSLPENERKNATTIKIQDLPVVLGNRRQLVQLFQHLLSNSIRFRGTGDPEIILDHRKHGSEVVVSIRDKGIGISSADQGKIFDLFFQGEGADETAGSGVGLAVARRIVRQHGGKIWVSSKPGEGSVFSFTLMT